MDEKRKEILEALYSIKPYSLNYEEWLKLGMALHAEGMSVQDWADWSASDTERFHLGECEKKWEGFHGASGGVKAGTLFQMAFERGFRNETDKGRALEWDDTISGESDYAIVDQTWLEELELQSPDTQRYDGKADLIKYLETLFEASENVGYVTTSYENDGRYLPNKGSCSRTAGELIQELSKTGATIGSVLGDHNPAAGAWIRFNPLDGKGIKNENVTDFRYALVESDKMELEKQNAILRKLELPIACLVHSANKSIHAIVKVEASSYDEYRKRVDYLYTVCKKNGLEIDTQNKNPSRLSRMPGVSRKDKIQYLIDVNVGKPSWNEWYEWIEGINDDLPEPESLEDTFANPPELNPELISGILRTGHKMLISGPAKAGKSFALTNLAISIAEGSYWLGWKCMQGKVLYVNLEIDKKSCIHRFVSVYKAKGLEPTNVNNIHIWNLRGKAVPMDKLAPKLIRRAQKMGYTAVIIDPIYKVITGDENSAAEMAKFTNQFDKICTELNTAVIYCHHHSKGYQGAKKAVDRASGSGVFARDPDAILDMTELELDKETLDSIIEEEKRRAAELYLKTFNATYCDGKNDDEFDTLGRCLQHAHKALGETQMFEMNNRLKDAEERVKQATAWRIEGTLREFPPMDKRDLFFRFPIHEVDATGQLADLQPEVEKAPWQRGSDIAKKKREHQKQRKLNKLEIAYNNVELRDGEVTRNALAEELDIHPKTVKRMIDKSKNFTEYRPDEYSEVIVMRAKNKENYDDFDDDDDG